MMSVELCVVGYLSGASGLCRSSVKAMDVALETMDNISDEKLKLALRVSSLLVYATIIFCSKE